MVGCLIVASGMVVQWQAYQSVEASVAGQPKLSSLFWTIPRTHGGPGLAVSCAVVRLVLICQGRAPECEASQEA